VKVVEPPATDVLTPAGKGDLWYLVYRSREGQSLKVKGTTESIRQNVKAAMLGDSGAIVVCRTKHGPFVPLRSAPEFRDLVVSAASIDPNKGSGKFAASAGGDTARSLATVPQTGGPVKKRDPEADIATMEYRVKPAVTGPRLPMKATPKPRTVDYMPWLILMLAVTAAVVGILIFTR